MLASQHDPVAWLSAQTQPMVEALQSLVEAESPSTDLTCVRRCAGAVGELGRAMTGVDPRAIDIGGRVHLHWRFGSEPRVMLIGHFDTVWPVGTLDSMPFRIEDGRAFGPGAFDMKAGIVQGFFALAGLPSRDGLDVLLTCDEELGSPTSRQLIEDVAGGAHAVLVLEPSHEGALKVARKGNGIYRIEITGRSVHAGLEPEKGVNALVELAHVVLAVQEIAAPDIGTTVTPTVATAGTAINVVPSQATIDVDVRAASQAEQERVDTMLRTLAPVSDGARITVTGGPNRQPMEARMSGELFDRALRLAAAHGLGELRGVAVGGGSDGNLTAALGIPTLDGLGAVGAGAHADHEHVVIDEMPRRAALVALLVEELLGIADDR